MSRPASATIVGAISTMRTGLAVTRASRVGPAMISGIRVVAFVDEESVRLLAVLAERFPMVADDGDDGSIVEAAAIETHRQLADLRIGIGDLGVVRAQTVVRKT